ncbi:MAG TPA: flavodoxin domain-containing protein [Vicinamibacterales bacterium]|nr:flavodoxin domain-containing protein [Vicinamibacterales bacterium]
MSRVLVLYGTTDGHTAKVAARLADALRSQRLDVDVVLAGRDPKTPRADDYAAVVVAASVHASGYQRRVRRWVREHAPALAGRPTAFVSVCLGVLQREPAVDRELDAIMGRFLEITGWRPTTTKIVAGALLYTQYNWLKRLVMKRIVAKAKGDTDTSRDYEYTDWADLEAFARTFVALTAEWHGSGADRGTSISAA